ncbi:VOC family protein [Candidatus Pacearchaeota archaeon]|nr:VOC family protein [Candidatus Pacearchaeota archaeon]
MEVKGLERTYKEKVAHIEGARKDSLPALIGRDDREGIVNYFLPNVVMIANKYREDVPGIDVMDIIGGRSSAIFDVDDIHEFIEKCEKQSVQIVIRPVKQFWGSWNAVIADPDGNEFIIDQEEA